MSHFIIWVSAFSLQTTQNETLITFPKYNLLEQHSVETSFMHFISFRTKQARKLQATLVRNYDLLAYLLTGVKCRATSVAKNPKISDVRKMLMSNCISVWPPTSPHKERYCQDRDRGVIFQKMGKHVAGTISLM